MSIRFREGLWGCLTSTSYPKFLELINHRLVSPGIATLCMGKYTVPISPGDQLLAKEPEHSGYEVGKTLDFQKWQ